jgi:hypothetical protein
MFERGEVHSVLLDKASNQVVMPLEVRSAEGKRWRRRIAIVGEW